MNEELYCLVGYKIGYSLSPLIHNLIFKLTKRNASYSIQDLNHEEFSKKIDSLLEEYSGMNVTIPYKEEIIKHLDSLSDESKRIGAVNVIKEKVGYNTDYLAVKQLVKERFYEITGLRCLILGAGGAAKAAAFALAELGCKIIIMNRTEERAKALAQRLIKEGYDAKAINDYSNLDFEVLVNAIPFPLKTIPKNKFVIDFFYNYENPFSNNEKMINGIEILVRQAILSQNIWQSKDLSYLEKEIFKQINVRK